MLHRQGLLVMHVRIGYESVIGSIIIHNQSGML